MLHSNIPKSNFKMNNHLLVSVASSLVKLFSLIIIEFNKRKNNYHKDVRSTKVLAKDILIRNKSIITN